MRARSATRVECEREARRERDESANDRASRSHSTFPLPPLCTPATQAMCSFSFKIMKVTSINTKSSVKQYFQDISQLKNSINRAMELSKCRKASLGNGKPVRRLQLALSLTNSS